MKWIPCSERLPDVDGKLWRIRTASGESEEFYHFHEGWATDQDVTHWMPRFAIGEFVDRFLSWPLPKSVCSDLCVTKLAYPHGRYGTSLLTADEARQMLEYVLQDTPAPRRPDEPKEVTQRQSSEKTIRDAEAAIDLFLEYRDKYGRDEESAKAAALNEFAEAESPEVAALSVTQRNKVIEECARVCEEMARQTWVPQYRYAAETLRERIRALKSEEVTQRVDEGLVIDAGVAKWLLGEGPHPATGEWFERPEGRKGAFWWRKELHAALSPLAVEQK